MAIRDWFSRRKSTSVKPSQNLLDALGNTQSSSGVSVNPTKAMQTTAVWACVQAISQDVAKIRPTLKRMNDPLNPDSGSIVVSKHPSVNVIQKPNRWQTWFEYAQFRELSILLWGNFYAYKDYDNRGQLRQVIPIRPDRVTILEAPDGSLFYQVSPGTTFERQQLDMAGFDGVTAPSDYIHHVRNMSLDTIYGMSPVQMFREAIGLSLATEKHAARSFSNGTRLSGVLKHPGKISDEAARSLKKQWSSAYEGVENAFKTALIEEGMEFQQLSMSHEDSQLLESRNFQVTDIARIYRVPPHKIGDLQHATFSNIESQSLEYYNDTLMPRFEVIEQRMALDFLTKKEREQGFFFEHDVTRLLRGDIESRYNAYATARNWGWMSVNEIRVRENMNPIPEGDEYMRPLNMTAIGTDEDEVEDANSEQ